MAKDKNNFQFQKQISSKSPFNHKHNKTVPISNILPFFFFVFDLLFSYPPFSVTQYPLQHICARSIRPFVTSVHQVRSQHSCLIPLRFAKLLVSPQVSPLYSSPTSSLSYSSSSLVLITSAIVPRTTKKRDAILLLINSPENSDPSVLGRSSTYKQTAYTYLYLVHPIHSGACTQDQLFSWSRTLGEVGAARTGPCLHTVAFA